MSDYENDRRWCAACAAYVPYLLSPSNAWCTRCGRPVTLFSDPDQARFERSLAVERGWSSRLREESQSV